MTPVFEFASSWKEKDFCMGIICACEKQMSYKTLKAHRIFAIAVSFGFWSLVIGVEKS